jgi:class 3 adenylate cyclase
MKTQMLQKTVNNISKLLQTGFGGLGAEIVANFFTAQDSNLDIMVPGKKIDVVLLVCRINQFTETTDCLQDEIIVYVNKIAKIVHKCAEEWNGWPNKNYGDRFFITWQLPSVQGSSHGSNSDSRYGHGNEMSEHLNGPNDSHHLDQSHAEMIGASNQVRPEKDDDEAAEFENFSKRGMYRKEKSERALMAAVKIIAELRRFQDL